MTPIAIPNVKHFGTVSRMPVYELIMIAVYDTYCTTFIAYELIAKMERAKKIERLKYLLN